jgi:hypothetical protein
MKRATIFLSLLAWTATGQAQSNGCTQDTVMGIYAFLYEGFAVRTAADSTQTETVPTVGVALESIDAQGAIKSMGYQSVGGLLTSSPTTGSIVVNSDCTGTIDRDGLTGTLVVLRDGEEMHSVNAPSAGSVATGRWKRISRTPNTVDPAQCSTKSVIGSYVTEMHGFVMAPVAGTSLRSTMPLAGYTAGSISASGANVARGTIVFGGRMTQIALNARITASPDCTFRFTNPSSGGTAWGVVLDGGNELWMIILTDITGDPVFTATSRRTTAPQQ